MPIAITDVTAGWFTPRHYRPRADVDGTDEWFLRSERFRPRERAPAEAPDEPAAGRDAVRAAFEGTYDHWELPRPPAVSTALADVAAAGTAVVVAGQQPGFLGGPLLCLYKALTAIAAARRYRSDTGRPCVPVFWVAGDDHDVDEVRTARFPGRGDDELEYSFPALSDRRPISAYEPTPASLAVVEAACEELAGRRFGAVARDILTSYTQRGLAAAFAGALSALLGEHGLLVVDPVRLRPLATDVLRRVIDHPAATVESIERGRAEVRAAGIEPRVAARLPLFLLEDGKRQHLSPTAAGLRIDGGGRELTREELRARLADDPRSFSPGALLRPLVQQTALPSVLTVGGPAEIAYFAQLGPLASFLGLPPPPIALRLGATLLDGAAARAAERFTPAAVARAGSPEELVVATSGEAPRARAIEELARHAEGELDRALHGLPDGTPDWRRLRGRVEAIPADIRRFGERLDRAWARTRDEELGRAGRLFAHVFPGGVLQERRHAWVATVARHGTQWVGELLDALADDPLAVRHWWIRFGKSQETSG